MLQIIYLAAVLAGPVNPAGAEAFARGQQLHTAGKWDEAISAFEQAETAHFQPGGCRMRIGRALARKGLNDQALVKLDEAAALEFSALAFVQSDADLAPVRELDGWKMVEVKIAQNGGSCRNRPTRRQFDFWLGAWEVVNAKGQPAGESKIELGEDGCVVIEHWRPLQGPTGQSLNTFDPTTGQWRQTWVDSSGRWTEYVGTFVGNELRYQAELWVGGAQRLLRMNFRPLEGGRVRQWGEGSQDGGRSWTPQYDFTYRPKRN